MLPTLPLPLSRARAQMRKTARKEAIGALNRASDAPKPTLDKLFTDVYDELPWSLQEQESDLRSHLARYPEAYPDVRL